ncbi:MAG: polysaccharide biosynthesis/export family protein [Gemmatimonadota bacterium]
MQFGTKPAGVPLAILACVLLGTACSSNPRPAGPAPGDTPRLDLRAGDEVMVQVWREEDLSGNFIVDDRGIVTLPLLGEREVTGLAAPELRDRLLADYREYLQTPSVEVTVLRRLTILGGVNEPGLYPVDASVSLSEALGLAGGISPIGNSGDIRVIRDGRVIRQDLDQATLVGATDIRSGDQILVGEKGWLARNPGALVGSLIGAVTGLTIALIR